MESCNPPKRNLNTTTRKGLRSVNQLQSAKEEFKQIRGVAFENFIPRCNPPKRNLNIEWIDEVLHHCLVAIRQRGI